MCFIQEFVYFVRICYYLTAASDSYSECVQNASLVHKQMPLMFAIVFFRIRYSKSNSHNSLRTFSFLLPACDIVTHNLSKYTLLCRYTIRVLFFCGKFCQYWKCICHIYEIVFRTFYNIFVTLRYVRKTICKMYEIRFWCKTAQGFVK